VIYLLYALHVVLCLFLILVVLLQQGKGADLSVFGGGTTMTAFGARSATTLLHRLTVGGFVGFVLTTILIAYLQSSSTASSVMGGAAPAKPPVSAPAPPTGAPATQPGQPAAQPAQHAARAAEPGAAAREFAVAGNVRIVAMPKWRNW
jgi:preprotein translocase subunit SecG